jgi:hypothetical protein
MTQDRRVVSLAVERKAETTVDLSKDDRELAVVVRVFANVWSASAIEIVVVLNGDGGEEFEIIVVVSVEEVDITLPHFRFRC